MRELNKNEFLIARRGLSDAADLRKRGYFKDALFALKRPKKLLEYGAQKTRMLALLYIEEARSLQALGRLQASRGAWNKALTVLEVIGEQSELKELCARCAENPAFESWQADEKTE